MMFSSCSNEGGSLHNVPEAGVRRSLGVSALPAAADGRFAAGENGLPKLRTFAFDPKTGSGVTFKVTVDVTKASFEQL
jgi:hypothetical protein